MSADTNISTNFEPLAAMATSAPMLFLCGSGISIPYPAALPSAWDMISWTSSILKPEATTQKEQAALNSELAAIYAAPPEVFYQGLFDLVGPVAVQPWTALSLHDRSPQNFLFPPGPTLGHLVVTYLSWRNRVPIVTTNFDTYFEIAACKLGVTPIPSSPKADTEWKEASADGTEVAIWKIHGSADRPESICATLDRISMLNERLLKSLESLVGKYRTCLLGYSGRDIDCFPFIANFPSQGEKRLFWIDFEFAPEKGHRIFARPERFIGLEGKIDKFAEALLKHLDLNSPVGERLKASVQECINTPPDPKEDIKQVYQREMKRIVTEKILPELTREDIDLRPLLHASSLASIHKFDAATRYCEQFLKLQSGRPDSLWAAKASIILASCYHNLSKYRRSEEAARHALKIAVANNWTAEAIYALSATDEAMRMQLDLDTYVSARPIIGKVKTLLVAAKSLLDSFRLKKWAHKLKAEVSSARVTAEILEHHIRLYALTQGILFQAEEKLLWLIGKLSVQAGTFLQRRRLRIADRLLSKQWILIHNRAYAAGYTAGVANALKFLLRAEPRDPPDKLFGASADQVFDLIKHKTGLALMQRDRGLTLVGEGKTTEAVPFFEKAQFLAHEEGNSSLELKALLGLCKCGGKVDLQQIRALAESVENDAQDKVVRAVLTLATKTLAG